MLLNLAATLLLVSAIPAASQPAGQGLPHDNATFRAYSELFGRIRGVDRLADRVEAKGRDPHHRTRRLLADQMLISDADYAKLRAAAQDYDSGVASNLAKQAELVRASKKQRTQPNLSPQARKQLSDLRKQRYELLFDELNRLQTSLSPDTLRAVDAYVRGPMHASSKVSNGKLPNYNHN